MRDRGLILLGLAALLGLLTFPIWYNTAAGTDSAAPELAKAKGDACIYDTAYMRENHMDVLIEWRDQVVRNGNRMLTVGGKTYEMSLSKTCLDCHSDKEQFCDKCHNYAAVSPYCWDCHVDPKQTGVITAQRTRSATEPRPEGAATGRFDTALRTNGSNGEILTGAASGPRKGQ